MIIQVKVDDKLLLCEFKRRILTERERFIMRRDKYMENGNIDN
jgi:hypothetical protein